MKFLVTGNLGYIGTEVVALAKAKGHTVTGFDNDLYEGCELYPIASPADVQIKADIRKIPAGIFEGVDAVIHLAALSNDPLCDLNPEVSFDVNHKASVALAHAAKKAGVKRFVQASTANVYGVADEKVKEDSPLDPVTIYAQSKLLAEQEIRELADSEFSPVFLRPSSAFGLAPRQRTDIVFNNFCGSAGCSGEIVMMSDGSPVRPVIHVRELAAVFLACAAAPKEKVHNQIFNAGRSDFNYSLRQMAETVQRCVPGLPVRYTGEHVDSRSYFVLCDKIASVFGNALKIQTTLEQGARELLKGYAEKGLTVEQLKTGKFSRLTRLKQLVKKGSVDEQFFRKE